MHVLHWFLTLLVCNGHQHACRPQVTLTNGYLRLLGLEDLQVVQVAWALAGRPQRGHCWPGWHPHHTELSC